MAILTDLRIFGAAITKRDAGPHREALRAAGLEFTNGSEPGVKLRRCWR